jgi:hypothetical protein
MISATALSLSAVDSPFETRCWTNCGPTVVYILLLVSGFSGMAAFDRREAADVARLYVGVCQKHAQTCAFSIDRSCH